MLPTIEINGLDPQALRALAAYLEKLAAHIKAHADQQDAIHIQKISGKTRIAENRERFYSAGQMVLSYIEAGTPTNAAIGLISAATGYSDEQVRFAYSLALRQRREDRDTVISWLKRKRWTDAEIAQVVDMHEKSVTRLRNTTNR